MLQALLTLGQVAGLLGCSVATVRRRIDRGDLKATRVGAHRRVYLHDLKKCRELWEAIEARASITHEDDTH
jgi:excisionase family DNA binding protein